MAWTQGEEALAQHQAEAIAAREPKLGTGATMELPPEPPLASEAPVKTERIDPSLPITRAADPLHARVAELEKQVKEMQDSRAANRTLIRATIRQAVEALSDLAKLFEG